LLLLNLKEGGDNHLLRCTKKLWFYTVWRKRWNR